MSFTSPLFYVTLVPAVAAFYWLPGRWRAIYLLALSYAFYALSSRIYLVLLIVASASVYALGVAIAKSGRERAKQAYMAAGVAAVVAVIAAFKAAGAWRGLLLPLGVSFYSFKLVSYLIEVYWDDEAVERDPVVFFLFPAFFPQIVSGPIQRPEPFFAQMRDVMGRTLNADQVEMGFRFILGGLMMKTLVGDRLADFIELIDKSHADYSYSIMLTTVACYMLQLYADFSGYTNIALGVGKLFGVEGPPNFNAPFAAVNIQEMWRRWHMSLTLWLTDYLFTPLSMSLRHYGQAGLIGAICLNMIIIGVWHGFTLNYLIFGMLHAVFLSVTVLILGERARRKRAAAGKAKGPQSPRWGPQGALLTVLGAALTFRRLECREKMFGMGRPRALDRNAKIRIMHWARCLSRRTEKGRAYGAITAKALAVLEALLWAFHNAKSGLCFPSYGRIAEAAGCARSTVAEALKALEDAGAFARPSRSGTSSTRALSPSTRIRPIPERWQI